MQICRNIRPSGHTYYQNLSHSLRPWSYKSSGCDPPSGLGGLKHFQGAEILRYRNIFIFSLDSGLRSFSVHSGGASLNILISLHIHSAQWAPHRVCPLYNCAINSMSQSTNCPHLRTFTNHSTLCLLDRHQKSHRNHRRISSNCHHQKQSHR